MFDISCNVCLYKCVLVLVEIHRLFSCVCFEADHLARTSFAYFELNFKVIFLLSTYWWSCIHTDFLISQALELCPITLHSLHFFCIDLLITIWISVWFFFLLIQTVQEMVMLSTSVLSIKWTLRGKPKSIIANIGGDLIVKVYSKFTLNQISGQVIEHEELWDLSASSPVAQAFFWASHRLYATTEAGKDSLDLINNLKRKISTEQENLGIYPDPSGDPTKVSSDSRCFCFCFCLTSNVIYIAFASVITLSITHSKHYQLLLLLYETRLVLSWQLKFTNHLLNFTW